MQLEAPPRPAPTKRRWLGWLTATTVALAAAPGLAQEVVSASPDITIAVGSTVVQDDDAAVDNQLGLVLLENLGTLPEASDVVALGSEVDGDRLIAFDTTTALAGGVVARKGDVVRTDGATYAIVFDASAEGVPASAGTDAVSLAPGGLLLSFDTTVSLPGGVVAADEDLVVWDGADFTLAFDGSTEGVDASLDVDGAQALGGGAYLLSFDTTGNVGGATFADEDVVRFDGAAFSLELDMTSLAPAWAAADLDAVFVPEPGFGGALALGAAAFGGATWRRRRRERREEALSPLGVAMGLAVLGLAAATGAQASDGVLEINQTCAEETGCFPGDSAGFPVTIQNTGSYRLTGNLVIPNENTSAIVISRPSVTVDLGGFEITRTLCSGATSSCRPTSGIGSGITASSIYRGITVRNGTITGMGTRGILLQGSQNSVEQLRLRWNRLDGALLGDAARVVDSSAFENGRNGVEVGNGGTIAGNTLRGNLRYGVETSTGARVDGNAAQGNVLLGILARSGSTITGNAVSQNVGDGIAGFGSGCLLVGNTSFDNGGRGLIAGSGSSVARNAVRGNTGLGMDLAADVAYRENVVSDNAGGSVLGGINLFSNSCNGTTTCP